MNTTETVTVEVMQEGVVIDNVARHKGAMVAVDRAIRPQFGSLLRECPKLVITPLIHGLIDRICFQPGVPLDVPPGREDDALERYKLGQVRIRPEDARAAGIKLPKTHAERRVELGLVRIRVLKAFHHQGALAPAAEVGWIIDHPRKQAQERIDAGEAEVVPDDPLAPAPAPPAPKKK
jgi:hypothetical protein